jgi:hypothetical protein
MQVTMRPEDGGLIGAFKYFEQEWQEQLSVLRLGVHISVVGRITTIEVDGVTLRDWELVDR